MRCALFLDLTHISAYSWQRGTLRHEGRFTPDETGLQAFALFVRQHRSSIHYLLADVVEESFQIEEIPYVRGRDRKALIGRRLSQYFLGTTLATAIPLGRNTAGRRDETLMFTALTRPQHFEPWLEVLQQMEVPLAGIYSVPLIVARLMRSLRPRQNRHALLLTLTQSGLRQSFLNDGQLRFSRLTPLPTDPIAGFPAACVTDSEKIHQYLVGQGHIEGKQQLEVLVLCHPTQLEQLRVQCRDSETLRFDCIDLTVPARKLGLKTTPGDSCTELLFLHLLLRHPPARQFASEEERKFHRLRKWRIQLCTAAAIILVCGLLFSVQAGIEVGQLRRENAILNADNVVSEQKYQVALRGLPAVPIKADHLHSLVKQYRELQKRSPHLEATLLQLSHALDASPQIELERIDWLVSTNPEATVTIASPPAQAAAQSNSVFSGYFLITEIHARLPVDTAKDHPALQAAIQRFVAGLRQNEGMRVTILNMPFDRASSQSIESSTQADIIQPEPPKFSLRLVQTIQP